MNKRRACHAQCTLVIRCSYDNGKISVYPNIDIFSLKTLSYLNINVFGKRYFCISELLVPVVEDNEVRNVAAIVWCSHVDTGSKY